MRTSWRGIIGVLVGCLGWAPFVSATVMPVPGGMMPWVIESADYTGDVKDQIVRLDVHYTIQVMRDGWIEVPLVIQGATITAIKLEKKAGEAHIVPQGDTYVLAVSKKGTYKVNVKCSSLLAQDPQFEGLQLGIPRATFSTMSLFVPRKDVELRPTDQLYVESQPDLPRSGVKLTARLGASDQIVLRWRTKPTAPVKVEPVLYGEVNTLVTIEEQLARLTSIIEYRIAQGETRQLEVHLPIGINVLNVRGAGIEDWRVTDGSDQKTLTVALSYTLKDTTYRLVVEGEQTIEGKSAAYTLPEFTLVGVKQERGYLAVSRAGSIELAPETMEGINRVDVKELPEQLRSVMGTPALLAFKYHQHPYRVALALTRHDDHPVLPAIAERGELATVISQQGELLTRATYFIRANKKQFLEVLLPEDAQLWSCIVGGRSVKPVEGEQKKLLIPLDTAAESAESVSVELVYFERRDPLTNIGHLDLRGPVLDVPTTIANWNVYAPREIKFLKMGGNLARGAAVVDFIEDPVIPPVVLAQSGPVDEISGFKQGGLRKDKLHRLLNYKSRSKSSNAEFAARRELGEPQGTNGPDGNGDMIDDRDGKNQARGAGYETAAFGGQVAHAPAPDKEEFQEVIEGFAGRLQETGILPLKIRLPKSGQVYHFNRLMTTQERLKLDATFVHLPMPWVPFAAFGLIMIPVGGVAVARIRRV